MSKSSIFALILSFVLTVALVPCLAFAAETNLAAGVTAGATTLTTQAASTPKITITRAATGKVAVKAGKSYKLGAKTTAGKLSYKSSSKKVATVSSKGVIKAKKPGKTTITITAKRGSKKVSKKVTVTVLSPKKYKPVKKIKVKTDFTYLDIGEVTSVKTIFTPSKASNRNVIYKSSNTKVLRVSASGKVTAVAPGVAKITVTSCDNAKAKASIKFEVDDYSAYELIDDDFTSSADQDNGQGENQSSSVHEHNYQPGGNYDFYEQERAKSASEALRYANLKNQYNRTHSWQNGTFDASTFNSYDSMHQFYVNQAQEYIKLRDAEYYCSICGEKKPA